MAIGIGDMKYGYSAEGATAYVKGIRDNVLSAVKTAIQDYSMITSTSNANWTGKAKDKFLENIGNDVVLAEKIMDDLMTVLENEVSAIAANMQKFDENLVPLSAKE